jgi:hypothetical protein
MKLYSSREFVFLFLSTMDNIFIYKDKVEISNIIRKVGFDYGIEKNSNVESS